jgi:hypothetical protein
MFGTVEGRQPARIEATLPSEALNHSRQDSVEIVRAGLRKLDNPHSVAYWTRQRIQRVRSRYVGDLAEIKRDLKRGVRVAAARFGLKKSEQAVPQAADLLRPIM